ncbi:MAG: vWA domain-containing protein [Vicinamibacterales bacterium]
MRVLRPEFVVWLVALPVLVAAWALHLSARRRFRRAVVFTPLRLVSRLTTWKRDAAMLLFSSVAYAAVVVALMRPQLLVESKTPEYAREDLVIVLDHSASMGARDVPPSRFGRAVQEIKTFLAHKPDIIDRVGLVEFAGTSLVLSHLTRDIDSLAFYLDWIRETPEVRYGTDLGAALATARELVRKDDRQTTKVFLVISDGADQGTQLAKELSAVRDERTRVYTVGIGVDSEAVLPVVRPDGLETLLEDDQGRLLTAGFDESTLRTVASQTGGRYVRSVTGADLSLALRDLVSRERPLLAVRTTTEYRDFYREALMVAAAAASVLLLLL